VRKRIFSYGGNSGYQWKFSYRHNCVNTI